MKPIAIAQILVVNFCLPNKSPDAIRLRYRMQDQFNRDSEFKLGFKLAGTGGGITLKKVDRAGSEAIFDLHTYSLDE